MRFLLRLFIALALFAPASVLASVSLSSNGYATTPGSADFTPSGNFTYAAWIKNTPSATGCEVMFGKNAGASHLSFTIENASGRCFVGGTTALVSTNIGSNTGASTGVVSASTWTSLVITRSAGTVTWYLNGSASGSNTQASAVTGTDTIYIGSLDGASFYFDGLMSNVYFKNGTAWTAGEVSTFNSTCTTPDNGSAYWKFQSSGALLTDASGNSHTLTVGAGTFSYSTDEPTTCNIVATVVSFFHNFNIFGDW